jgi:hypothetical protein
MSSGSSELRQGYVILAVSALQWAAEHRYLTIRIYGLGGICPQTAA